MAAWNTVDSGAPTRSRWKGHRSVRIFSTLAHAFNNRQVDALEVLSHVIPAQVRAPLATEPTQLDDPAVSEFDSSAIRQFPCETSRTRQWLHVLPSKTEDRRVGCCHAHSKYFVAEVYPYSSRHPKLPSPLTSRDLAKSRALFVKALFICTKETADLTPSWAEAVVFACRQRA